MLPLTLCFTTESFLLPLILCFTTYPFLYHLSSVLPLILCFTTDLLFHNRSSWRAAVGCVHGVDLDLEIDKRRVKERKSVCLSVETKIWNERMRRYQLEGYFELGAKNIIAYGLENILHRRQLEQN